MDVFTYTVWHRNNALQPEDKDHEVSTSFNVIASNQGSAQQWGDKQAKRMSGQRKDTQFVRSQVELGSDPAVPTILYGHDASDKEIGW